MADQNGTTGSSGPAGGPGVPSSGGALVPLGAGAVVLLALLHLVGFVIVFGLGVNLAEGGAALVLNAGVASLVAPLLALFVGLTRWAPTETVGQATGLVRPRRDVAWHGGAVVFFAVVLGLALAPVAAELTARVFQWMPMPPMGAEERQELIDADRMGLGTGVVVFACLLVLAPIVEEMLYRGFLARRVGLRPEAGPGSWRAALFIAVVYAAVQINVRFAPSAFLLAVALAHASRSAGSTWAAIAGHIAHRTLPLVFAVAADVPLPDYSLDADTVYLPWEVTAACAAIAAVAAFALWRLRLRPPPPLPKAEVEVEAVA